MRIAGLEPWRKVIEEGSEVVCRCAFKALLGLCSGNSGLSGLKGRSFSQLKVTHWTLV